MKMCLAPCYKGCTDERYAEEAAAVESFLATRGESRLVQLRTQREEASANLEFETAAAIHAQVQKVESIRALAPELVRPMNQLRAVILQPSAQLDEVGVFLFRMAACADPPPFRPLACASRTSTPAQARSSRIRSPSRQFPKRPIRPRPILPRLTRPRLTQPHPLQVPPQPTLPHRPSKSRAACSNPAWKRLLKH